MGPKFLCKRYISFKIDAKQIEKKSLIFQNSNINIDWYRWSINRHGSHLSREMAESKSAMKQASNWRSRSYTRRRCKSAWSNISSALISIRAHFIFSKVSHCRNSLSAFYSLFHPRIELDQFPARKSDRNDIESLSSRATSPFCACYVRKSWRGSLGTLGRKSISSTNYTGIVEIMRGTRSRSR